MNIKKINFILLAIIITAAWLRFYNLDWSKGVVWHPDERNMAVAVEQLRLPNDLRYLPVCYLGLLGRIQSSTPLAGGSKGRLKPQENMECNFNPKFFAYGGFPLYLSFVTGILYKSINTFTFVKSLNFLEATIFLRIISAAASVLSVFLSYLLARSFFNQTLSVLVTILVAFTPGLIQAAHFGTTESLISLLLLSTTLGCLRYYHCRKDIFWALTTISVGLALATKISSIVIISVPLTTAFALIFLEKDVSLHKRIYICSVRIIFLLFYSSLIFLLASPYNFLSFRDFRSSMDYEGPLALGTLAVFYTRQFINTQPLLFHLEKILPYTVGPHLSIFGLLGLIVVIPYAVAKRSFKTLILPLSFLSFFLPNSLIFAKWTRFISPTFPYFALLSVFLLSIFYPKRHLDKNGLATLGRTHQATFSLLLLLITTLSIADGLAFFSIYTREDVRYTASRWIYKNIPAKSFVLSETANVSDIPILPGNKWPENYQLNPVSFNFYELDQNQSIQKLLVEDLQKSDFIFIPSRRVFKNHLRLKDKYPILSRYYENLFNGNLGFHKVAEFSSYPSLNAGGTVVALPDEEAEETFTVFDHPVVRIFKKNLPLKTEDYRKLLEIKEE